MSDTPAQKAMFAIVLLNSDGTAVVSTWGTTVDATQSVAAKLGPPHSSSLLSGELVDQLADLSERTPAIILQRERDDGDPHRR